MISIWVKNVSTLSSWWRRSKEEEDVGRPILILNVNAYYTENYIDGSGNYIFIWIKLCSSANLIDKWQNKGSFSSHFEMY